MVEQESIFTNMKHKPSDFKKKSTIKDIFLHAYTSLCMCVCVCIYAYIYFAVKKH